MAQLLLDLHDDVLTMVCATCPLADLNALARSCIRLRELSAPHREAIAALCKPPFSIAVEKLEDLTYFRCGTYHDWDDPRLSHILDADVIAFAAGILLSYRALSQLATLSIGGAHISDKGIAALVHAMAEGRLPVLTDLTVAHTRIADVGVKALAHLFARAGALPKLRVLRLYDNHIQDAGTIFIAGACFIGALPSLLRLDLDYNGIGDAGFQALACASVSGTLAQLSYLSLRGNSIGDAGVSILIGTDSKFPSLTQLILHRNKIGDAGCITMAEACSTGALPALRDLYLFQRAPALQAACESRHIRYH